MPGDPETLGELSRRLDRLDRDVGVDIAELRAACAANAATAVSQGVYVAERSADRAEVVTVAERVKSLEGRISWAWRTALTALAFPVVVAAVAFVIRGGGP